MFKSTPLSERGDIDSSSSTSAFTSATDTSKRTAPTLLSVLQQTKPSDLSRKRVIRNNLPPKGKKRKTKSATGSSSSLKSVAPDVISFLKINLLFLVESFSVDVVENNCH